MNKKKKVTKRITAWLMCLAMVLTTINLPQSIVNTCAAGDSETDLLINAEAWDGSVATTFAGGNGSVENPYQIANGAQLAYLAQVVNDQATNAAYANKCYLLTADIDLSNLAWTPIGKNMSY